MKKEEEGRRSFLKHVLAGTAVVAGVAATRKSASARQQLEADHRKSEVLYKETDAFKKYYESVRS